MLSRERVFRVFKRVLARFGVRVSRLERDAQRYMLSSFDDSTPLPPGARDEVRSDHPRLRELRRRYDTLEAPAAVPSQWTADFLDEELTLPWFRGDNAYVWQYREFKEGAELRMYVALLDVASRDDLSLLDRLEEDGAFGAWTFQYGERRPLSRDLLDSVNEINYLNSQIGFADSKDLSVLDIGAGYGRLAHRMAHVFPHVKYDCIDGVAESTFLSEYYLNYRCANADVRVVPLDAHEMLADTYTVAVNVHSFSECTHAAIEWWLDRIAERDVEWLFIVPNHPTDLLSTETDGTHRDFSQLIADAGYELVDSRPQHQNDEFRSLIGLEHRYFLFRHAQPLDCMAASRAP